MGPTAQEMAGTWYSSADAPMWCLVNLDFERLPDSRWNLLWNPLELLFQVWTEFQIFKGKISIGCPGFSRRLCSSDWIQTCMTQTTYCDDNILWQVNSAQSWIQIEVCRQIWILVPCLEFNFRFDCYTRIFKFADVILKTPTRTLLAISSTWKRQQSHRQLLPLAVHTWQPSVSDQQQELHIQCWRQHSGLSFNCSSKLVEVQKLWLLVPIHSQIQIGSTSHYQLLV